MIRIDPTLVVRNGGIIELKVKLIPQISGAIGRFT
jgi:hypothetical protein